MGQRAKKEGGVQKKKNQITFHILCEIPCLKSLTHSEWSEITHFKEEDGSCSFPSSSVVLSQRAAG